MEIIKTYTAPNGSEFVIEYDESRKQFPYMVKRSTGETLKKAKSIRNE